MFFKPRLRISNLLQTISTAIFGTLFIRYYFFKGIHLSSMSHFLDLNI